MSEAKYGVWWVSRDGRSDRCFDSTLDPLGVGLEIAEDYARRFAVLAHPDRGLTYEARPIVEEPLFRVHQIYNALHSGKGGPILGGPYPKAEAERLAAWHRSMDLDPSCTYEARPIPVEPSKASGLGALAKGETVRYRLTTEGDAEIVSREKSTPCDFALDVKWADRPIDPALAEGPFASYVGDEMVARSAPESPKIASREEPACALTFRPGMPETMGGGWNDNVDAPADPTRPTWWSDRVKEIFASAEMAGLILPVGHEMQILPPPAEHLARRLFATDSRIEALVALRAERPENRARVLDVAWERDEYGAREEALARAEKMLAYERDVHPMYVVELK